MLLEGVDLAVSGKIIKFARIFMDGTVGYGGSSSVLIRSLTGAFIILGTTRAEERHGLKGSINRSKMILRLSDALSPRLNLVK